MFRVPRRSSPPVPPDAWRKTFPDIIRRGKAIDFLATVGMSTDGIAYNHYGIKYVLKRLEDQRSIAKAAHTWREREQRGVDRVRETGNMSHTHRWKKK